MHTSPHLPAECHVPDLRAQRAQRVVGLVSILLITLVSFWIAINPMWVQWIGSWGYVGAFFISLVASATIVLPAPGIAVVMAMGTALDPVLLGIVAGIGSAVGELSGYLAGYTGRALIDSKQQKHFDWIHRQTERYGAPLLLLFAAIPFPLFDLAGIVAGITRMRIIYFLNAVAIGKSIKYIIMILAGTTSLQMLLDWISGTAP